MCCPLFRLLCCWCGCCADDKELVSNTKSLAAMPSKTRSTEKRVNQAVLQASTASSVKTMDLTEVFEIPSTQFQTEYDVIRYQNYEIDWNKKQGKGRYGTVYKAIHTTEQSVVAVKVIATDARREANLRDVKNELFIMEKISHPHIIQLFTHFIVKDINSHKNQVFIFMRFAENNSLSDYIRTKKVCFEEPDAKRMFAQITSAVAHMHGLGIAHRDLKLGNVLLDADMNAMVSDFGLSQVLYRQSGKKPIESYKQVGTPEYMAPEILLLRTTQKPYDAFAADIWALGVILYAMINRCYPFGTEPTHMITAQHRFEQWNTRVCRYYTASTELTDIIRKIFVFDKNNRIKTEELVKHIWIKDEIQTIIDKINDKNLTKHSLSE